jgi:hypothetical protein
MAFRGKYQSSMEFMVVIGFALLMITPVIIMYSTQRNDINDRVNSNQAFQIARKIVDSAESVYYFGEPSKTTIRVFIPRNVVAFNISRYEVIVKVRTQAGVAEIVQVSKVNISGDIPPNYGVYDIEVVAKGNYVLVNRTQ